MNRTPVNTWLDEKQSTATPPRWSDPDLQKKLRNGGIALAVTAVAVGLIFGATSLFGGDSSAPVMNAGGSGGGGGVSPQVASTIETTITNSILGCQETRTAERSQSSGPGDTDSAEGTIIAYEYAFFGARDARRMTELSAPSASVATEDQLAVSIASMPVDTPWCVDVAPTGEPDKFDVAVRFIEADGTTVTTWSQFMTVPKNPENQYKISAVQAR